MGSTLPAAGSGTVVPIRLFAPKHACPPRCRKVLRYARNDEVRYVLNEAVDREIGVALIIPFRRDIVIVGKIGLQKRVAAGGSECADPLSAADVENRVSVLSPGRVSVRDASKRNVSLSVASSLGRR